MLQPSPVIAMTEPFEIVVCPDRSGVAVALAGELDLATVGEVRRTLEHLRGLGWRDFVVDLQALTFLDSTGVHLLLETYDRALAAGGSLTVVSATPEVHRVLELTGVADRLEQRTAPLRRG